MHSFRFFKSVPNMPKKVSNALKLSEKYYFFVIFFKESIPAYKLILRQYSGAV